MILNHRLWTTNAFQGTPYSPLQLSTIFCDINSSFLKQMSSLHWLCFFFPSFNCRHVENSLSFEWGQWCNWDRNSWQYSTITFVKSVVSTHTWLWACLLILNIQLEHNTSKNSLKIISLNTRHFSYLFVLVINFDESVFQSISYSVVTNQGFDGRWLLHLGITVDPLLPVVLRLLTDVDY